MRKVIDILYKDALFFSGIKEDSTFKFLGVTDGKIQYCSNLYPIEYKIKKEISLNNENVYPALTDSHIHMLYAVVSAIADSSICSFSKDGIYPNTLSGALEKIKNVIDSASPKGIIYLSGYISSGMQEKRLPNRFELDSLAGDREVVIFNIDGHSSSMSTSLLKRLDLFSDNFDGILVGEMHEFNLGKIMDAIAASLTPQLIAKGLANFENECARCGVSRVVALEGSAGSRSDLPTNLMLFLAKRMNIIVKTFLQYKDISRVEKLSKHQSVKRIGGCGEWEADGSIGSNSASLSVPFIGQEKINELYYSDGQMDAMITFAINKGFTVSTHAIGDRAINQVLSVYEKSDTLKMHRIDHFELPTKEEVQRLIALKNTVGITVQPGYSLIDKRFIGGYKDSLPQEILDSQVPLKTLMDEGVVVCGSSDAPVQGVNPFIQMRGMTDFYNTEESLSNYEAFTTYTKNAAKLLGEKDFGVLSVGMRADFFTTKSDIFMCKGDSLLDVEATNLYIGGNKFKKRRGSLFELVCMLFRKTHKI